MRLALRSGRLARLRASALSRTRATALTDSETKQVTDLDEKKAQAVVDEINNSGGRAIAVAGDVTAQDFPKRAVDATVKAFGTVNVCPSLTLSDGSADSSR